MYISLLDPGFWRIYICIYKFARFWFVAYVYKCARSWFVAYVYKFAKSWFVAYVYKFARSWFVAYMYISVPDPGLWGICI